jgi:hypothetical protein
MNQVHRLLHCVREVSLVGFARSTRSFVPVVCASACVCVRVPCIKPGTGAQKMCSGLCASATKGRAARRAACLCLFTCAVIAVCSPGRCRAGCKVLVKMAMLTCFARAWLLAGGCHVQTRVRGRAAGGAGAVRSRRRRCPGRCRAGCKVRPKMSKMS